MQIEILPIDQVRAYENNPRLHPPRQIERIANSIREFGFNVPILVDGDDNIIAGHGRLAAALQLEMTEVPAIRIDHMTPEQVKAYRIADNRLNELGGWDEALLINELKALEDAGGDPLLTGYDQADIDSLMYNWPDNPINPEDEWEGMPEFQEDAGQKPVHTLTIQFYTKKALKDFQKQMGVKLVFKGKKISSSMRLPETERRDAKVYEGGDEEGGEGDE